MSKPYRTGDLYLENVWSLQSILEHVQDPSTRWSNAGIFIIDPDRDGAREDGVQVCILVDGKLQLLPLDTLLRRPQLQAAAHRSLASSYRGQTSAHIESYLRSFLEGEDEILQESSAFRNFLGREIAKNGGQELQKDKKSYTNLGTPVDAKGRDVKPPGFSKGNPNNVRQSSFTPEGLIMAALANIVVYDPDVPLSTFQSGGGLDDVYGSETPLFPREVDESDGSAMEHIMRAAQQEAHFLIQTYLKVKRKMTTEQFRNYPPIQVNASRDAFLEDLETVGDNDGIPTNEAVYVEQMSNQDHIRRKNMTIQLAEEQGSETLDRKLRQRKEQAARHNRPQPQFK